MLEIDIGGVNIDLTVQKADDVKAGIIGALNGAFILYENQGIVTESAKWVYPDGAGIEICPGVLGNLAQKIYEDCGVDISTVYSDTPIISAVTGSGRDLRPETGL